MLISNFISKKKKRLSNINFFFKVIFKYIKGLNSFFALGPYMHQTALAAKM